MWSKPLAWAMNFYNLHIQEVVILGKVLQCRWLCWWRHCKAQLDLIFQWVPLPLRPSYTPKATVPWPTDWVPDKWLEHSQIFPLCACFTFIPIRYVRIAWTGLKANKPQVHGIDDFITDFEPTWLGIGNLLQPSGTCIQRRALERTKGAQQGQKNCW